jgi:hypothetical protein
METRQALCRRQCQPLPTQEDRDIDSLACNLHIQIQANIPQPLPTQEDRDIDSLACNLRIQIQANIPEPRQCLQELPDLLLFE